MSKTLYGIRSIVLLTLRLPTLLESNLPGNFLWAWEFHPLTLRLCLSQSLRNPFNLSTETHHDPRYMCIYIYIYIHIHIYTQTIYIYIYICTYIHTYICTQYHIAEDAVCMTRKPGKRASTSTNTTTNNNKHDNNNNNNSNSTTNNNRHAAASDRAASRALKRGERYC